MKCLPSRRIRRLSIGLGIVFLALAPLSLFLTSRPAEAQCGSSASSCKNCHEVQGQDPVSNNGEWHVAHAFGDFCEFCHAGNVQAKSQDEAHIGLVDPLIDVKASCQSCHPQDYQDKAQVYATVLGVTLGSGGTGGSSGGESSGTGSSTSTGDSAASTGAGDTSATTTDAATASSDAATVNITSGGEVIDFNELYVASMTPEQLFTFGDKVLIALIALLLIAFVVAIWIVEGIGTRLMAWWRQNMLMPAGPAVQGAAAGVGVVPMPSLGDLAGQSQKSSVTAGPIAPPAPAELDDLFRRRPDLRAVWPLLVRADDRTLQALAVLLPQAESAAVIQRLGKLNLALVTALQELSPADQALLLALAQKR